MVRAERQLKDTHRYTSTAHNGEVTEDWRRAVIVPAHKKGSKLKSENYWRISLLGIPSKVYAEMLDDKGDGKYGTLERALEALERAEAVQTNS